MERVRQDVGQRAASVYGNRGRGSGEAGGGPVGSALEGLRFGFERSGTGLGQHPNSPAGYSGAAVQGAGLERGAVAAAVDLMAESPSDVDQAQLEQLGIQIKGAGAKNA